METIREDLWEDDEDYADIDDFDSLDELEREVEADQIDSSEQGFMIGFLDEGDNWWGDHKVYKKDYWDEDELDQWIDEDAEEEPKRRWM